MTLPWTNPSHPLPSPLPTPSRTRPNGCASGPSTVRPPWFSYPVRTPRPSAASVSSSPTARSPGRRSVRQSTSPSPGTTSPAPTRKDSPRIWNPAQTANTVLPASTARDNTPSDNRLTARVCAVSSPPPSTYRSACSGTASSTPTSTSSASMSRHRSRCARTLALPPSPYVPSNDGNTSAIRTADSGIAHNLAIALERRVVGEYVDGTAPVGRADRLRQFVHPHMLDAGIAQPHRDVAGSLAGRDGMTAAKHLERHVPQPGGIAAFGGARVDGDDETGVRPRHLQRFGPAGRVLREQEPHRPAGVRRLQVATLDRRDGRHRMQRGVGGDSPRRRRRGGQGCVADVDLARDRELDPMAHS